MLDAELFRFTRRMQRVRKQKESGNKLGLGGTEHRGLSSTVGVAAEKDPTRDILTQNCYCVAQAGAIAFRIARKRRARAPLLPEGQITAQDDVAVSGKSFADHDQKRSIAIPSPPVTKDHGGAVWARGRGERTAAHPVP